VFIRSGALTINASEINADNYGSGPGGTLALRGDNQIALSNGTSVHAMTPGTGSGAAVIISTAPSGVISADSAMVMAGSIGPGNAGPLSLATGQLTLTNGASLTSSTQGSGQGGPITISGGSVVLNGGATLNRATGIFSTTSLDRLKRRPRRGNFHRRGRTRFARSRECARWVLHHFDLQSLRRCSRRWGRGRRLGLPNY
jgi:hypothetical protein